MKLKAHLKFKSNKVVFAVVFSTGLLLGLVAGYLFFDQTYNIQDTKKVLVVRVIDGDTIELADGSRVRYLGIDTPEAGEPFSSKATIRNKQLVEGKQVELQCGIRDQDEYGRLLRYVYVDGVFVNAELVAQGYAKAYIFDSNERYSQILVQLEQYAKIKNRGLWEK